MKRGTSLSYNDCFDKLSENEVVSRFAAYDGARLYVITKYRPETTHADVSYRVATRHDVSVTTEIEVYSGSSFREAVNAFNANTVPS